MTIRKGPADATGIAFFDVDKTLLSVNSATLWLKREFKAGSITPWQTARAAFWVFLYERGRVCR